MPENLLTILNFCFLALLYLFFVRVLRAVWVQTRTREAPAVSGAIVYRATPAPARATKGVSRLVVVEPAAMKDTSYDLGEELTLGRAAGCHILLDDTFVSQIHARAFRRDNRVWIEDLGSTNGTLLNQSRITAPVVVHRGDRVQVGQTVLEVTG